MLNCAVQQNDWCLSYRQWFLPNVNNLRHFQIDAFDLCNKCNYGREKGVKTAMTSNFLPRETFLNGKQLTSPQMCNATFHLSEISYYTPSLGNIKTLVGRVMFLILAKIVVQQDRKAGFS